MRHSVTAVLRLPVKVPRVYLFHHQSDPGAKIVKFRNYDKICFLLPEPSGAETDYDGVEPRLPLVQVHRLQLGECLDPEVVAGDHAQ